MPRRRMYSGPLLPGTTSVRQVNRRNKAYSGKKFSTVTVTKNKAVNRVQNKLYVPKQIKNSASINVLANQVKKLQLSQMGRLQSKIQSWRFPVAIDLSLNPHWDTLSLWRGSPMCFALNDFTKDARVTQGYTDPNLTVSTYNYQKWSDFNGLDGAGDMDDSALTYLKDNIYWKTEQDNTVSKEYYLPIKSDLMLEFSRAMTNTEETECVRIDIIKAKNIKIPSIFEQTTLPTGLAGLTNLAAKEMFERNKLNSRYFTRVKTKYLYFKNNNSHDANTDRRTIRKYFKWSQRFPDKPLKTDYRAYDQNEQTSEHMSDAQWIDVIDPKEIYWMLISVSTTSNSDRHWKFSMMRTNYWRDPVGTN